MWIKYLYVVCVHTVHTFTFTYMYCTCITDIFILQYWAGTCQVDCFANDVQFYIFCFVCLHSYIAHKQTHIRIHVCRYALHFTQLPTPTCLLQWKWIISFYFSIWKKKRKIIFTRCVYENLNWWFNWNLDK